MGGWGYWRYSAALQGFERWIGPKRVCLTIEALPSNPMASTIYPWIANAATRGDNRRIRMKPPLLPSIWFPVLCRILRRSAPDSPRGKHTPLPPISYVGPPSNAPPYRIGIFPIECGSYNRMRPSSRDEGLTATRTHTAFPIKVSALDPMHDWKILPVWAISNGNRMCAPKTSRRTCQH